MSEPTGEAWVPEPPEPEGHDRGAWQIEQSFLADGYVLISPNGTAVGSYPTMEDALDAKADLEAGE